jgi:predicted secreted protein
MKPLTINSLILFTLGLVFSSCRFAEVKKEAPEINFLKTGEKFRITLPEDHRKGETWQVKKDESYQAFEDLGSVWHGVEKGLDINLKALSSGQYTLSLVKTTYKDSLELKQFIVNIKE